MKKYLSIVFVLILVLSLGFAGCGYSSKEPCAYCNKTPTKAYKTSNGGKCYVCESCSSRCFFCNKKATKHFSNLLDAVTFVCDDCYKGM